MQLSKVRAMTFIQKNEQNTKQFIRMVNGTHE